MSDSLQEERVAIVGEGRLSGELTIQNAAAQCQQMREWIDSGVLAIDLSGVESCDSSGVQILVAARRSAANAQSSSSFGRSRAPRRRGASACRRVRKPS